MLIISLSYLRLRTVYQFNTIKTVEKSTVFNIPVIELTFKPNNMKYTECIYSLDYFNSMPCYAKPIAETNKFDQPTGFYYIKFCCNINLARAVYSEFIRIRPLLKDKLKFHVNLEETKVIFGGRFMSCSTTAHTFYTLLSKHKAAHGSSKPKKIKELA